MSSCPPLRITTVTSETSKGRSFSGTVPMLATSNNLWGLGSAGESIRPIAAIIVASSQEARPLHAVLRDGGKAVLSGGDWGSASSVPIEFPRSADYDGWNCPQGILAEDAVAVHVWVPGLFRFVPPVVNEERVGFVVMPSIADLYDALKLYEAEVSDATDHAKLLGYPTRDLVALGIGPLFCGLAAVWASHLQRRTIWAIPQRLAFRVQLLLACLKQGIVTMGDRSMKIRPYREERSWWNGGLVDFTSMLHPKLGMHPGLATLANKKFLQEVLAHEVGLFDSMRRGKVPMGKAA